jgi:large repetitive protein
VISVTATDAANLVSKPTTVVVKDTTPPAVPVVTANVTDTDHYITGTAEPNSVVTVKDFDNKKVFGTSVVKKDGTFKIPVSSMVGYGYVRVSATDANGNVFVDGTVVVVKDTTPPAAPKIKAFYAKDTQLVISTEYGATLNITYGDKSVNIICDMSTMTIDIGPQPKGEKIEAYATDFAGNVGRVATTYVK